MYPFLAYKETVVRLLMSAFFGGSLGWERSAHGRPAGITDNALVATTAALAMMISKYAFGDMLSMDHVGLDPSRLAAQVVNGVSFIGVGVIIRDQNRIKGITTSGTIWVVAGIGLATGAGWYFLAICAWLQVMLLNNVVRPIEQRKVRKENPESTSHVAEQ